MKLYFQKATDNFSNFLLQNVRQHVYNTQSMPITEGARLEWSRAKEFHREKSRTAVHKLLYFTAITQLGYTPTPKETKSDGTSDEEKQLENH
jgi:hypothetical protein